MPYLRRNKICSIAGGHQKPVVCPQLFGKPEITDPEAIDVTALISVENV